MTSTEGGDGGSPTEAGAASRTLRPLITPDAFSGDSNWDEWIEQFEGSALVNGWDDAAKLLWLRVRLTGRAQTAWKRLSTEAKSTYDGAKRPFASVLSLTAKGSCMQPNFMPGSTDRLTLG